MLTRRLWLGRDDITFTQGQIDRAFDDKQTRLWVVRRADIKLSAAQVDRCIETDDFQVRVTCVKRADFEVTDARFTILMSDENSNIPREVIRESNKRGHDLAPFVAAAFRQGYPRVLTGMLKAEMPFTDAQLAAGSNSADRDVKIAFCRIHGQHCNR